MHLTIDRGNTRVKAAQYLAGQRHAWWQGEVSALAQGIRPWLAQADPTEPLVIGWLSVAQPDWEPASLPLWQAWAGPIHWHQIDHRWPFPLVNRYATPNTLGTDRLVGVVAARAHCPGQPVLVIDAGTALTYDVATADGQYLGGGIAPGLQMRFDALHHFTARLPLVSPPANVPLIGNSTEASIQAGVYQGMIAEIDGMVQRYREAMGPDLQVFLTGGDLPRFENQLSCFNFADPHLILHGVYHLLTYRPFA
jgi:type III pantothenate kinase